MSEEQDIVTQDEQDDTTQGSSEVSVETLNVQKRKALEQRDEERKKNEELQKKIVELQGLVPKNQESSSTQTNYVSRDELDQVKFVLTHKDLEAEDVDELVAIAKGKGVGLNEAYESKTFQSYFKDAKNERDSKGAIPQTNRANKYQPPKPPSQMTRDEHKAWEESLRS